MDPDDLDALWRAHLASVMHQSVNVPDSSLREMLRRNRPATLPRSRSRPAQPRGALAPQQRLDGARRRLGRPMEPVAVERLPADAHVLSPAPDGAAARGHRAGPARDVPAAADVRDGGAGRDRGRPPLPPGRLPPHLPPGHAGLPRPGPQRGRQRLHAAHRSGPRRPVRPADRLLPRAGQVRPAAGVRPGGQLLAGAGVPAVRRAGLADRRPDVRPTSGARARRRRTTRPSG